MQSWSRREMLKATGVGALGVVGGLWTNPLLAQGQPPSGPHALPRLPYANDALQPSIDARTMEIHHGRHHQAYVTGLNTALQGQQALLGMTVEQLLRGIANVPMAIRQAVTNHGGGHYNHTMFWQIMGPNAGGQPQGNLAEAINSTFQSFDNFKAQLKASAMARFGSGWAWLVKGEGNRLEILSTANQDCPLMQGKMPVLGVDVWEHAYYLHYQNRRADYIDAWWNVVNWRAVGERFAS